MRNNPYRHRTNDKIADELARAKAESDKEQRWASMDPGSSSALKQKVNHAKKRVKELDEKISLLEQAQSFFDKYGNDNLF